MTEPGGASADVEDSRRQPSVALWGVGVLLTLLAFVGVVVALNATVYSATGFSGRYLDALERRDLATLLELPGVELPPGADAGALTRDAMAPVDSATVGRVTTESGTTTVEVQWSDAASSGITRLRLEEGPRTAGLFTSWRFAATPLVPVAVSVEHAATVRVGDTDLELPPPTGPAAEVELPAFTPSVLVLGHESRYLTAQTSRTVVDAGGVQASVDVEAGPEFVSTVQDELDDFLAECATQKVLLPAGCPFGTFVDDRLTGPPSWELVDTPKVEVVPGGAVGEWRVPSAPGTARVTAEVISLFDGSRSALDETVPFQVSYRIELDDSGSLQIIGAD
jgi:hypothetical protein